MANVKYAKLSELLGTTNTSITTIFREKGSSWSSGWHNGVDIAAPQNTPIKAVADGNVINADTVANGDGFGNRVVLKHADGRATLYAHMVRTPPVKVGQSIKKGDIIGYVGSTGLSYGAHLHFTIIDKYDIKPNIYYGGHLLDPIVICGLGELKFSSSAKSVIVNENGKTVDLGNLSKYYEKYSDGTPDTDNGTATDTGNKTAFKLGDIVTFNGGAVYGASSSTTVSSHINKASRVKITNTAVGAKHPYHAISQDGVGVYGWVDADTLSANGGHTVEVTTNVLNVRAGAGTNYAVKRTTIKGDRHVIVEEKTGTGANKWGKISGENSWIALDYTVEC